MRGWGIKCPLSLKNLENKLPLKMLNLKILSVDYTKIRLKIILHYETVTHFLQ